MIQAWIGLNHVLITTVLAMFGFWQISACMLLFAMTLILGMKLLKNIEEEKVNIYVETQNLTNNMNEELEPVFMSSSKKST